MLPSKARKKKKKHASFLLLNDIILCNAKLLVLESKILVTNF